MQAERRASGGRERRQGRGAARVADERRCAVADGSAAARDLARRARRAARSRQRVQLATAERAVDGLPAARSARASAEPSRPAPTTPTLGRHAGWSGGVTIPFQSRRVPVGLVDGPLPGGSGRDECYVAVRI